MEEDDDLTETLRAYGLVSEGVSNVPEETPGVPEVSSAPQKLTSIEDLCTDDEPDELFDEEPKQVLALPDDPEEQRRRLCSKFPDADPAYIDRFVASSRLHVEAALGKKKDKRADKVLRLFFRQGGSLITQDLRDDGARNAGGAVIAALRDTGLVVDKSKVSAHVSRYEINLFEFRRNRSARSFLNAEKRRKLLSFYGGCNLCGAQQDLQFDHRTGVVLGGGEAIVKEGLEAWQVLCRRCNNDKEHACENVCPYRREADATHCKDCSWANPEEPAHTAGEPGARILVWLSPERLHRAKARGLSPHQLVKQAVEDVSGG